jgi:LCP family protein required for cell wall assembly
MGDTLGGNPLMVFFPQNILVLGTDTRSAEFASSEAQDEHCVEAAATGAPAPNDCFPARADTIMVLRAGGGAFEKLSIPRDAYAAIPGQSDQKINAAYAFGGAKLQVETVEQFLGIDINHVAIVDFAGFVDFIDAIGGVEIDMPRPVCNTISGTYKIDLRGTVTLSGEKALALARTRSSTCGHAIDDLDRARFQQLILQGIKERLTDPLRIPRNFLFGPVIGWNAPKAFVSDMGALAMPQLALAAAIGGSSESEVLKPTGSGPGGSLLFSSESCAKGVKALTGDAPDELPMCSPGAG